MSSEQQLKSIINEMSRVIFENKLDIDLSDIKKCDMFEISFQIYSSRNEKLINLLKLLNK